ncbi:hypothetical protein KKF91_19085, partial [Myxococcota bacterium]|nr:hypothetical protein [Myxococcota bacterium]
MRGVKRPWAMLFMLALVFGCKDNIADSAEGDYLITPPTFRFQRLSVGEHGEQRVNIESIGGGELRIAEFDPSFGAEFNLYWIKPGETQQRVGVEGGVNSLPAYIDVPSGETLTLIMSYTPTSTAAPSGVLRFRTNSTAKPEGSIPIEVPDTAPEIAVAPTTVDFERVPARTISELPVTVTNIGQAPLQILRLQVSGSAADPQAADPNGFWVTVGGEDPVLNSSVLVDPDGDGVPGLKNGQSFDIMVHYQTLTDGQDEGFLSIFSNDTIQPEYKVALKANGASPCARVDPNPIEFPASLINRTTSRPVSLESCGGEKLMILDVYLKDGSSDAFTLDENTLPEFPYELPAFDASQDSFYPNRNITLNFHPTQQAPYTGTLVVVTNDPALYADVNTPGEYEIPITGLGTINECPVACVAQEEFNVPPLEIISLDASCSMDLDGP